MGQDQYNHYNALPTYLTPFTQSELAGNSQLQALLAACEEYKSQTLTFPSVPPEIKYLSSEVISK